MSHDTTPRSPAREHSPSRFASAVGGLLLGGSLVAAGGFFVFALWSGFQKAKATRSWQETPCEVVRSEVVEEQPVHHAPPAYRAAIEYRYTHGGVEFMGVGIKQVDGRTSHRKKAEALVAEFPVGARPNCWVDPADPGRAILKHSSYAPLYSIWFPALFVVGGLGITWRGLRGRR